MQEKPTKQWIRIFLASPGDTAGARAQVVAAVHGIASDPAYRDRFDIQLCRWDDPDKPVPLSWNRNPQHEVVGYAGNPADCDLLICLLRHKFGSPLPEEDFGLNSKGVRWTGTEWELAQAQQEKWLWRDVNALQLETGISVDEQTARFQQFQAVETFCRSATDSSGSIAKGYHCYESDDDLRKEIDKRLREWLEKRSGVAAEGVNTEQSKSTLSQAQQALLVQLLASGKCEDQELLADARRAQPVCVQSYLLGRYAWWAEHCQEDLEARFVNLQLHIVKEAGVEGERYGKAGQYNDLSELLTADEAQRGVLLVGDPGSGKSTILQHFEMQQAVRSLQAIEKGEAKPELCVWLRLSSLHIEDAKRWKAAAWLDKVWAEIWPLMPSLTDLGVNHQLRFILDGLNEIKVKEPMGEENKGDYRDVIAHWVEWLAQGQGMGAPLFSVRTLNHTDALTGTAYVSIARWDEKQRREYVMKRLPVTGGKLLDAIELQNMGDFNSLPINLSHQCALFDALGRPARDRAELMSGLAWLKIKTSKLKEVEELLGDRDRRQMADPQYWREHLLELPKQGLLVQTLDAEALAMHRESGGTEIAKSVENVALSLAEPKRREYWLEAVHSLQFAHEDLGGDFRFVHHSWQEFFAARGLSEDNVPDMAPPSLKPIDEVLTSLGLGDPLPGPGVSKWEESAKLALQLAPREQRLGLLAALQKTNLPLATRAALSLPETMGQAHLDPLRQALLERSRDAAIDLRLRIEAGELLGELGDHRYRDHTSAEGVRYRLPNDEHWVQFPAGEYMLGSEAGEDDERPVLKVALDAFAAAFAPVSNAEYRLFIKADGYEDERWWPEGAARQWQRGEWAQDDRIAWFEERFAALRDDFDAAVAKYYSRESDSFVEIECRKYAAWEKEEASEILQSNFGAKKHKQPSQWNNPLFNRAAQPVVGVCVFEAEAYCRWLAHHSEQPLTLPNEAQWESAARGLGARPWPFVGEPFDRRFNHDPTHLRRTAPIGVFPESDSVEGLLDMAGNIWEWTGTDYQNRLSKPGLTSPASAEGAVRSVRGGGWHSAIARCRSSYRDLDLPAPRSLSSGFRVFFCPIQSSEP